MEKERKGLTLGTEARDQGSGRWGEPFPGEAGAVEGSFAPSYPCGPLKLTARMAAQGGWLCERTRAAVIPCMTTLAIVKA